MSGFILSGKSYQELVLSMAPIAYWPMNETSGTTVKNVANGDDPALDGTYTNPLLAQTLGPDGDHALRANGTNTITDIYSSEFNSVFDGNLGSFMGWFRVSSNAIWTDSTVHDGLTIFVDLNNYLLVRDYDSVDNQITVRHRSAGSSNILNYTMSTTDWYQVVMTWDQANSDVTIYINGQSKTLTTDPPVGVWSGNLDSTRTVVGSAFNSGAFIWNGNYAHIAFWDYVLTAEQAAELYAPYKKTHIRQILETEPDSLIAYWPLNEADGTIAINNEGTSARNGTYIDTVLNGALGPDNRPAPDFSNGTCDIYSASFDGVFDGSEGTVVMWIKVSDSGIWTDGVNQKPLSITDDANNFIVIDNNADNTIRFRQKGGGTALSIEDNGFNGNVDWIHLALTWSETADEVKAYVNGTQTGGTQAGMGVWNGGGLNSAQTVIGSGTTTGSDSWGGYIAHVAIWTYPLTQAQIAAIYGTL